MKLEYSIFQKPDTHTVLVEFRVIINKDDYILLNQFPDTAFSSFVTIEPGVLDKYSDNFNFEDAGRNNLLNFNWGKNVLEPTDEEDILFKSEKYWFEFKRIGGMPTGEDYINYTIPKIGEVMKIKLAEGIKMGGLSCYKETQPINYNNKE